MPTIEAEGINVEFPYEPYETQVEYIQAVVKSLNEASSALLESPTGTGKTLCLLCSTLAWLKSQQSALGLPTKALNGPKIIYCSRTHSQLSQVIKELKESPYGGQVSTAILGAREHCCVNREVRSLPNASSRSHACQILRSEKRCRYFNALSSHKNVNEPCSMKDIEELVADGTKEGFCPYFLAREQCVAADIVFMPYNYIVDPSIRKRLPFSLDEKCVVIIDEAHNLPSVLSSVGCCNLTALTLASAIRDCSRAMAMLDLDNNGSNVLVNSNQVQITQKDIAALKIVLKKLEDEIKALSLSGDSDTTDGSAPVVCRDGTFMIELLERALITREVYIASKPSGMQSLMTQTIELLSRSDFAADALADVQSFLDNVFSDDIANFDAIKFVLQNVEDSGQKQRHSKTLNRSVGFWCLESAEMEKLQRLVRSLVLTSGTLSPLKHFAAELRLQIGVEMEGTHVIQRNQLAATILTRGPGGEKLNGSYACRMNVDYRRGLGMSILNIARCVPGGTLVFFPSYAALYSAVDLWRSDTRDGNSKTIWGLLCESKPLFLEPTDNADLGTVVQKFKEAVDGQRSGAILLAVCRGKISEGFSLSDNYSRCVIVTGIPYANHTDLFVRLKKEFLSSVAASRPLVCGKLFNGNEWYRHEAMRAVNQCVGRVIRHKNDAGAVVLADERFSELTSCLSRWVQPSVHSACHFRDSYSVIVSFFSSLRKSVIVHSKCEPQLPQPSVQNPTDPELLEKARDYVAVQRKRGSEDSQIRHRRKLEEANELPRNERKELLGSSSSITDSTSTHWPITMTKFVTPVLSSLSLCPSPVKDPISQIGSSSKEFCSFLKVHLSESDYQAFKGLLMDISSFRKLLCRNPVPHEKFDSILLRLATVFKAVTVCRTWDLLIEFGRYIPEELRALYARQIRKLQL